jgi:hypothetical protein
MTKLCTPISAGTSFPNTPESDTQLKVSHDVTVQLPDGTVETVRFMATDPMTAIDDIRSMSDERFKGLPRVKRT